MTKKKSDNGDKQGPDNVIPMPPPKPKDGDEFFDSAGFLLTEKGKRHGRSPYNIQLALEKLGVRLSYDEFADQLLIWRNGKEKILEDPGIRRLWFEVGKSFRFLTEKGFFPDVVIDLARQNSFHPVRDYLNSLEPWTKKTSIDTWLIVYGGAPDTPFVRAVSRLTLIAAVRRIRQPGCKFDELPTFESPQGWNKSSALRILAVKPEWFDDSLRLNLTGKEAIEIMRGHWIIEVSELSGMSKAELQTLKAFLSRTTDKGRLAYDRVRTNLPRQSLLFGTTNDDDYLSDMTGNRRYWPVKVGTFDLKALERDRDQLWAEACEAEASGESIRLAEDLWAAAAAEQDRRTVKEPWIEVLARILGRDTETGKNGNLRTHDAWRIVGVTKDKRTTIHEKRLGVSMKALGFKSGDQIRFGGGQREYVYRRGTADQIRAYQIKVNDETDDKGNVIDVYATTELLTNQANRKQPVEGRD